MMSQHQQIFAVQERSCRLSYLSKLTVRYFCFVKQLSVPMLILADLTDRWSLQLEIQKEIWDLIHSFKLAFLATNAQKLRFSFFSQSVHYNLLIFCVKPTLWSKKMWHFPIFWKIKKWPNLTIWPENRACNIFL